MFKHRSFHGTTLALILIATFAAPVFSNQNLVLTSYSITGSGGTVTVGTSGSNTAAYPGGISSSSTTTIRYLNGMPMNQVVPTYQVYMPSVITGTGLVRQPCLAISLSSSTTSYWEAYQLQQSALDTWNSLIATYPPCEYRSTSINGSSAISLSPVKIVTSFWNSTMQNRLPVAQFQVPPGLAITGLPAYLVSQCTLNKTYYDSTPLGTATIAATGELWVKWSSNGPWNGPFNRCGNPWPDGTISHVYQHSGSVTIRVKETWSASWTLGNGSGILTGLVTAPAMLQIPVISVSSEIFR